MSSLQRFCSAALLLVALAAAAGAATTGHVAGADPLERASALTKTGKHADALAILSAYRPVPETLSRYHALSAEAHAGLNRATDAVEHLRLSYLSAPERSEKERLLLARAELYLRVGSFYEARSALKTFLAIFPDSPSRERAYSGLARSLSETGLLREAVDTYDKAGVSAEVLFGRANALHRLGMVNEAAEAYADAIARHAAYLPESDESRWYYAENLRLAGNPTEAKAHLAAVKDLPFRLRACISLGLIALEESRTGEAEKQFRAALDSPERSTRRQALLHLAGLQMKAGNTAEAKKGLETIRRGYPYGDDYDAAILMLAEISMREGGLASAASLLRELVFRTSPKKEALDMFERIITEARTKNDQEFALAWKSAGPWLLDVSREKFLLSIAGALKPLGMPFLDLCRYLARYGSEEAKVRSRLALAGFYAEMGEPSAARGYLKGVRPGKDLRDEAYRVEAQIAQAEGDFQRASARVLGISRLGPQDAPLLARLMAAGKDPARLRSIYERAAGEPALAKGLDAGVCDISYQSGRREEALGCYRQALVRKPDDAWAFYRVVAMGGVDDAEVSNRKVSGADSPPAKMVLAVMKDREIEKRIEESLSWKR